MRMRTLTTLKWLAMVFVPLFLLMVFGVPAATAHAAVHHVTTLGPGAVLISVMGVATYAANHLRTRADRRIVNFAPGVNVATLVTLDRVNNQKCLPIAQFRQYLAGFMKVTGAGAVTTFKIIAATAADGTGNTPVVAHALGTSPSAAGASVWLECEVEQIREVLAGATHVGVEITLAVGGDTAAVTFTRADPQFPQDALTFDNVP